MATATMKKEIAETPTAVREQAKQTLTAARREFAEAERALDGLNRRLNSADALERMEAEDARRPLRIRLIKAKRALDAAELAHRATEVPARDETQRRVAPAIKRAAAALYAKLADIEANEVAAVREAIDAAVAAGVPRSQFPYWMLTAGKLFGATGAAETSPSEFTYARDWLRRHGWVD